MSESTGAAGARPAVPDEQRIADAVRDGFPRAVARLGELVRIPSVSWPAFERAHVRRSAEQVAELARTTGLFERVEIHEVADERGRMGQPAVLAVRPAAEGMPTVMLYAHHDVQPPGDDALWETPVFEPTVRGERLYGRGASDDKAGVMVHIAALEALRDATGGDPRIGVVLFVEGEEEDGSPSFARFLAAHAEALRADVIVVADSDNPSTEVPGLTVSLRGNVVMRVRIRTLEHASHSGMWGGAVPDALLAAFRTLDSLWDAEGRVAVPGLVRHEASTADEGEEALRRDAGVLPGVRTIGEGTVRDRLWHQPAITITGIDAPDVANASNTILPETTVRLSARIAPGQDPQAAADAIVAHLRKHAAFGAHLEVSELDLGAAFLVDVEAPAVREMIGAMRDGWGAEPELTGIGGSIPFIAQLVERFPEAQILVTGVEDPQTRAHSPNESQHLGVLRRAVLSEALFLSRLGRG
ncbi:MAG: dipeptidase [Pseudoclavibacter sp.]|nr:dipeptidase [Pseudoclavibacter sp.]